MAAKNVQDESSEDEIKRSVSDLFEFDSFYQPDNPLEPTLSYPQKKAWDANNFYCRPNCVSQYDIPRFLETDKLPTIRAQYEKYIPDTSSSNEETTSPYFAVGQVVKDTSDESSHSRDADENNSHKRTLSSDEENDTAKKQKK